MSQLSKPSFHNIGLWLGPILTIALQFVPPPEGLSPDAWLVVSMAILMVFWWVSEAIPIPVTSLLPLIVLPFFDVISLKDVAVSYSSPIVLLLLGGFIIAKSIEKWNLHTRLALNIVARIGGNSSALVGGFMLASAILSMWISNSATTIMLVPIGVSVARAISGDLKVDGGLIVAILLAIAYGASIGGLGTPIGTPTNLIIIGYLEDFAGQSIGFLQWMLIGIPVVCLILPVTWFVLTKWSVKLSKDQGCAGQEIVEQELAKLGKITTPEIRTILAFAVIASAWLFRMPLNGLELFGVKPFSGITDPWIAIFGVLLMFLVPSGLKTEPKTALLDWETAKNIPWGVLLLFGGGLGLALAITQTGLAIWLADQMSVITTAPAIVLMLILVVFVVFATELVSNVAAASAVMPVIGAMSIAGEIDLLVLAIPVAMAASCAFMLPMATGPNAIVFGTGQISMRRMAQIGFKLNVLAIGLITVAVWWLIPIVFQV